MNKQTPAFRSRGGYVASGRVNSDPGALVDIKAVLGAVRRRFLLMAATFLIVFTAIAASTFTQTPIFSTTARIVIDTRDKNTTDIGSALSGLPPNTAIINTEVEIIRSQALLSKVVETLDLTQYEEFNYSLREPSATDRLKSNIKSTITGFLGSDDSGGGEESQSCPPVDPEAAMRNYAASVLRWKINVNRLGPTYAIDITANSVSPQLAADIANAVAEQYLVEQLESKLEATRRTNEWLADRLSVLRDEVNSKENAVESYRAGNDLLSAEGSLLSE
ncbi:MAG: Wzz/FepE/Etk N-terminal domain-containing protein, partial [Pseudomonadota bacterium]